jgi:hypothetical protein
MSPLSWVLALLGVSLMLIWLATALLIGFGPGNQPTDNSLPDPDPRCNRTPDWKVHAPNDNNNRRN